MNFILSIVCACLCECMSVYVRVLDCLVLGL